MKNKILLVFSAGLAAILCLPLAASAAEKKSSPPAAKEAASPAAAATKAPRAIPLRRSMVSAVNEKEKSFTVAGKKSSRTFKITDKTVITKDGAAATSKDIVPNVEVTGSYWKHADGTLEAKTVKVGAVKSAEKATEKKAKSKKEESKKEASPSPSPKA